MFKSWLKDIQYIKKLVPLIPVDPSGDCGDNGIEMDAFLVKFGKWTIPLVFHMDRWWRPMSEEQLKDWEWFV